MGTNYYLMQEKCEHCMATPKKRHIGKSSAGWCFSLHIYPNEGVRSLGDWRRWFDKEGTYIRNEYGEDISVPQMLSIITERHWKGNGGPPPHPYKSWIDFHNRNHTRPGPNGLLRASVDGTHCVGNGTGTYDYIIGDFS